MKRLRRNYVKGGTYFFTVVTHMRRPILTSEIARTAIMEAIDHRQSRRPFDLIAYVILPDHLHAIWQLPPGDDDYSIRWAQIKERFTRNYILMEGSESNTDANRSRHRERAVWQHRFWEHTIEDDEDYKRCLDYIHWNPVKHGMVSSAAEYEWSSFLKWVDLGEYDREWGQVDRNAIDVAGAEWD